MTGDASPPPEPASSRVAGAAQLKRGSLKERVFKASAWVIVGLGVSQVLRFGGNIVLASLLAPEHFGLMMMISVVLHGVQMFSDVGLRGSIVRHSEGDHERFVNTAWTIQVIRGFMLWGLVCALAWPVSWYYDEPRLIWILPVIGINTLVQGFASTSTLTLSRHVQFGKQVRMQLTGQVLSITLMVTWASLAPSVWALVAGGILNVLFLSAASHFLIPGYRNRFAWDRETAKEIFNFGRWIVFGTILQFLLLHSDKLVLGKLMTTQEAGVYFIAVTLAESAVMVLRRLSVEVLLPVYSRLADRQDRAHFRRKTFQMRLVLLSLSLPPLWVVAIFAPAIIGFLYPEEFADAGWMLRILAIGTVGTIVALTAERVTLARGDSFRAMVVQLVRFLLLAASLAIGYHLAGTRGVLMGLAAARIVDYPVLVWSIRRYDAWLPALDFIAFALSGIVMSLGIWWMG